MNALRPELGWITRPTLSQRALARDPRELALWALLQTAATAALAQIDAASELLERPPRSSPSVGRSRRWSCS